MAISKNKTNIVEKIIDKEVNDMRYYYSFGYYYDYDSIEEDYYSYDYYHDYCYKGYSDCECEHCVNGGYTTIVKEDAFGNEKRLCIPAGKEWFRKSQIDILLEENVIPIPLSTIHSQLMELGLVA